MKRIISVVLSFFVLIASVDVASALVSLDSYSREEAVQMNQSVYYDEQYGFEMLVPRTTAIIKGFSSTIVRFRSRGQADVRVRVLPVSYKRSIYLARSQSDVLVEDTAILIQNRKGRRVVFRHSDGSETLVHVLSLTDKETIILSGPMESFVQRSIIQSFKFVVDDLFHYESRYRDIAFDFPRSYELRVKEESRRERKIVFHGEGSDWFSLEVNRSSVSERRFAHEDANGFLYVGGMLAEVYQFENGVCSGRHCNDPFVAVRVQRNGKEYVWVFNGRIQLDEVVMSVLGSVQFK